MWYRTRAIKFIYFFKCLWMKWSLLTTFAILCTNLINNSLFFGNFITKYYDVLRTRWFRRWCSETLQITPSVLIGDMYHSFMWQKSCFWHTLPTVDNLKSDSAVPMWKIQIALHVVSISSMYYVSTVACCFSVNTA